MLPLEWLGRIVPRPGTILVRRDEQPETYGTFIIIPPSAAGRTKSSMATVEAVGDGVRSIKPGDRLLIAAGVSRKAVFGERDDVVLYSLNRSEVICRLREGTEADLVGQAVIGRVQKPSPAELAAADDKRDEGVSAGRLP